MSQLDKLIKDINKQYKEDIASTGIPKREFKKIPFSSPRLNYMTYGGVPRGRLIEFAGHEGGGKTTTALDIVANAQKLFNEEAEQNNTEPKRVVYCDCENTLDEGWAIKLGVDVDSMILLKPQQQTAEQIFEMLLQIMATKEVGLVILDSLGVLVSQQAYDKTMEEKTMGGIAAPLTLFSKKAIPLCSGNDCTLIAINQVREDMAGFGQLITVGGKAWKHNCSLRLVFKKGDLIDENNNTIKRSSSSPAGNLVEVAIEKNKVSNPDRRNGFYTLNYSEGVDVLADTVDLAVLYGIIQKGGSWFSIIDIETGEIMQQTVSSNVDELDELIEEKEDLKFQGRASLLDYLKENEELFELISNQVKQKLEG